MYLQTHHSSDCKVWALLLLLAILEHVVECEDTRRDQIVRLQKIEILIGSATIAKCNKKKAYLMVDAKFYILAPLLLLFDKACGKRSASSINDATTLFPLDRRMQTKVFTRCETQSSEVLNIAKLFRTIFHQSF